MKARSKGLSLLEVVVATSVLSAVLASAFSVLRSATTGGARATLTSHLRVQAAYALDRVARELQQSSTARIVNNADGTALIRNPTRTSDVLYPHCSFDEAGKITWEREEPPMRRMRRIYHDPTSRALTFVPPVAGAPGIVLASNVDLFQVSVTEDGLFQVAIRLSAPDPWAQEDRISAEETFELRPIHNR
jgi:type II secretory pathway pseudopilin PulG